MRFQPNTLILTSSVEESNLILDLLSRVEVALPCRWVTDGLELKRDLEEGRWNLIIADWRLLMSAEKAASIELQDLYAKAALIVVVDDADEDEAVQWLDRGVRDVIRREKIERMVPIVKRELRHARLKDAEDALRNEFVFSKAGREAYFGGWEWDLETDEFFLSPGWRRIHGCEQTRLSIRGMMSMVVPEDLSRVATAFRATWEEGRLIQIEYHIVRQDRGDVRLIAQLGEALLDEKGKPVKVLGMVQDITELEQMGG
jgi:phosphoserine phosphatase RsbU/P